jgi:hypothetical protein
VFIVDNVGVRSNRNRNPYYASIRTTLPYELRY